MLYRFFKALILAYVFLTVLPATGLAQTTDLPDIGGIANAPSPEVEHRMGQAVMRNLRRAGALVDDLQLTDYINNLGYRLLATHEQTGMEFHFFLVNDKVINAFALPGGYIGINYGLILASRSEDELAAVVAHEIAHVTQKHYSRSYAHQSSQIPVLAAIIAAAVLGNAQVGQAAIASSVALQAQQQLSFSRANEREADRIGIAMLAKAGFDPHGMAAFFGRLEEQSRLYGPQAPEFLRTHPVTVNRITDANNRASQYKYQPKASSTQYLLMRSRLQVLSADQPADIMHTLEQQRSNTPTPGLGLQYGCLLAELENKDYSAANKTAAKLKHVENDHLPIRLAILQTELHQQPKLAIKRYQDLLQFYPNDAAVIHDYAEALLSTNKPTKAQNLLNQVLKKNPEQPLFFRLLAKTESLLSNQAASHQAMAEFYYQTGQVTQAIQQLDLALKAGNLDFYRLSQIEARQAEFKDELQQLKNSQDN